MFALVVAAGLPGCGPRTAAPVVGVRSNAAVQRGGATASRLDGPAWFEECAAARGLDHVYRNGVEAGRASILESLGGGVGALDYDRDGWTDYCFTGGGQFGQGKQITSLPTALFRNRGGGFFESAGGHARIERAHYYSHGVACADFDEDGFADVAVTGYGGLMLYHNQGDGTFVDVTVESELVDPSWSSSAAWGDLNDDGRLDLYVVHYVDWSFDNDPYCGGPNENLREICPPASFRGLPDSVFLSHGDGTFFDGAATCNLRDDGKGLGVLIGDVDLDSDVDVYVANDNTANFLYRNEGGGKFAEAGLLSGTALGDNGGSDGSMGVDLGDFDRDGLPDIWVANFERESFALYRNLGGGIFHHVSQSTGVTAISGLFVGWGTMFADFDCDADSDLFVANGHVVLYPENAPLMQQPLLLENIEGQRVRDITAQGGRYFQDAHMGRGAVASDMDNDGALDLIVSNTNQPAALLRNIQQDPPGGRNWLELQLIGRVSPRDAIGARVELATPLGRQTRQRIGGASYASTGDSRLHVGLGTAASIDELTIAWPSGRATRLQNVRANQTLTVMEP